MRQSQHLFAVATLAFIILGGAAMNTALPEPFVEPYHPSHHLLEWVFVGSFAYLFMSLAVARFALEAAVRSLMRAQWTLLAIATLVFIAYSDTHHWEGFLSNRAQRTWFHEQIAVPVLISLAASPLILLVALRSTRVVHPRA